MALEAGETMHQMYAAVRLWQLGDYQGLHAHELKTADRIFGFDRWKSIRKAAKAKDARDELLNIARETLYTSGFKNDPSDETRTLANMEMASIYYVDEQLSKLDNWPIWVADKNDPLAPVGIEQVFDITLEYSDGKKIRFIGTIDGLVHKLSDGKLFLDENKTANRIDRGWRMSFEMRHQCTGYCAASSTVFGFPIMDVRVTGNKIKPANRGEDVYPLEVSRKPSDVLHWGTWVRHSVDLYERYEGDFENAPRYTHACNRYFRPCSLIPFCCDTPEGRIQAWNVDMEPVQGSPSERAIRES